MHKMHDINTWICMLSGEMIFYEKGLEDKSTESKINENNLYFAKKLKIEVRGIF